MGALDSVKKKIMEQPITYDEFKDVFAEQQYKHVGLFTDKGKAILTFNSTNAKASNRVEQIETRLKAPALKDGFYLVRGKSDVKSTTNYDEYVIKKGNPRTQPPTPGSVVVVNPGQNGEQKIHTMKEALELEKTAQAAQIENAALIAENIKLKEIIVELEEEIEIAEEESMDDKPKGGWGEMISEAISGVTPLLDAHFELENKKLNLEAQKLLVNSGYKPDQPKQLKKFETYKEQELENMSEGEKVAVYTEYLTRLQKEDPEAYAEIVGSQDNPNENEEPE